MIWTSSQKKFKKKENEIERLLVFLIKIYRAAISPLLPASCIYTPTCSEYAIKAIATHGAGRGTVLAVKRIIRCHPWHKGGYDPVPEVDNNE